MTRCQPGNLCEIIKSTSGNEGRRVVVLHAPTSDRETRTGWIYGPDAGQLWIVQPLQPLRVVVMTRRQGFVAASLSMDLGILPDSHLRPIGDEGLDRDSLAEMQTLALSEGIAHG